VLCAWAELHSRRLLGFNQGVFRAQTKMNLFFLTFLNKDSLCML
jgi:hypothetical protein